MILTKDGKILTSNGSGGKQIVEITTPLLRYEQDEYGEYINFEFNEEWINQRDGVSE